MGNNEILSLILLMSCLALLWCYNTKKPCCQEPFSLSKKPFEVENSLLNRNPFDDIDYQTPVFHPRYQHYHQ